MLGDQAYFVPYAKPDLWFTHGSYMVSVVTMGDHPLTKAQVEALARATLAKLGQRLETVETPARPTPRLASARFAAACHTQPSVAEAPHGQPAMTPEGARDGRRPRPVLLRLSRRLRHR